MPVHLSIISKFIRSVGRQVFAGVVTYWAWRYKFLKNNAVLHIQGNSFQIIDGLNFYMQYKDIFLQKVYQFETTNPCPVIIDGGSNIGVSILFFHLKYPHSQILGFEPDPEVFHILSQNVERLNSQNIQLLNTGLGGKAGEAYFKPDGNVGGTVTGQIQARNLIKIEQLSSHIQSEVDYLKMNIEGLECEVLEELVASGKLKYIRQLAIEYHGWHQGSQSLGKILHIFEKNGFRYMIHDFDYETCSTTKPPVHFSGSNWFCMVYAMRAD